MGWVSGEWRRSASASSGCGDIDASQNPNSACSTRRIVKSQCKTEEVEPGKFVRKCEKTEQILKDCAGRPTEVVQSNKEYTEDDVTDEMVKGSVSFGSSGAGQFDFPGLRSDIESIQNSLFGGIDRFFDAAEEMKNGFFSSFAFPRCYDGESARSPFLRQGIPIEEHRSQNKTTPESDGSSSGYLDLSGLAKDV